MQLAKAKWWKRSSTFPQSIRLFSWRVILEVFHFIDSSFVRAEEPYQLATKWRFTNQIISDLQAGSSAFCQRRRSKFHGRFSWRAARTLLAKCTWNQKKCLEAEQILTLYWPTAINWWQSYEMALPLTTQLIKNNGRGLFLKFSSRSASSSSKTGSFIYQLCQDRISASEFATR